MESLNKICSSGNRNFKKLLIFQEVPQKVKTTRSEKVSYISKNGTF